MVGYASCEPANALFFHLVVSVFVLKSHENLATWRVSVLIGRSTCHQVVNLVTRFCFSSIKCCIMFETKTGFIYVLLIEYISYVSTTRHAPSDFCIAGLLFQSYSGLGRYPKSLWELYIMVSTDGCRSCYPSSSAKAVKCCNEMCCLRRVWT